MKQIVLSVTAIFMIIGVVLTVMVIYGPVSEQDRLDKALRDSCYEALSEAVEEDLSDSEMVILMQRLFFGAYNTRSDEKDGLWFGIKAADSRQGILSARVETSYRTANGKTRDISSDAVVILEQEEPRETITVRYYVSAETAKRIGIPYVYGEKSLYQEYVVEKGFELPQPTGIAREDIVETEIL